jgi:hypothetical protein
MMTFLQKFMSAVLPKTWAEEMQKESRSWMVRCTCGFERSVWDIGGIRWKAKGNPKFLSECSSCRQNTWHTMYHKSGLTAKQDWL